jgi:hypothetical protein
MTTNACALAHGICQRRPAWLTGLSGQCLSGRARRRSTGEAPSNERFSMRSGRAEQGQPHWGALIELGRNVWLSASSLLNGVYGAVPI